MNCPCKDCDKKGCGSYHDQCEPYQQWMQYREAKKQEQRDKEALDHMIRR